MLHLLFNISFWQIFGTIPFSGLLEHIIDHGGNINTLHQRIIKYFKINATILYYIDNKLNITPYSCYDIAAQIYVLYLTEVHICELREMYNPIMA